MGLKLVRIGDHKGPPFPTPPPSPLRMENRSATILTSRCINGKLLANMRNRSNQFFDKDLIPTGNALRASAAHSSGRISSFRKEVAMKNLQRSGSQVLLLVFSLVGVAGVLISGCGHCYLSDFGPL